MKPHPYRLRPYHNPANVDESKVPAGWRFRYADEMLKPAKGPCRAALWDRRTFSESYWLGMRLAITYIVPVA